MHRYRFILTLALISATLIPVLTAAQTNSNTFVPLANYEGSQLQDVYGSGTNAFGITLNSFWGIALSIGAFAAVLRIVYAGFLYEGGDFWDKKQKGREILKDVVIGLLLLFGIWLILYQINPCLLDFSRILKDLKGSSDASCSISML